MRHSSPKASVLEPKRTAPIILAAATALLLTLGIVVAQQAPDFGTSYKTGPMFAMMNEVITYTVVAVNTGDPAQDVILSDAIPFGATYIPGSCTYYRPAGSPQSCGPLNQLWQEDFNTDDQITTSFAFRVTAGSMQWPLENCATLTWDSSQQEMCFTTTVNQFNISLPFVARNFQTRPDLRVTSLVVEPSDPVAGQPVTITLEIRNVGTVAAGEFWVDLYDNPDPPPTGANQPWNLLCTYGIAWRLLDGLGPKESVTLTSLGGYHPDYARWPGHFAASGNHDLYAFVDSWSSNWSYGMVLELNEGLDNRYGPLSVNVAPGAARRMLSPEDPDIAIPPRPNPW